MYFSGLSLHSRDYSVGYQEILKLLRFENIFQILRVTEIQRISWWQNIDNFKLGQIEKTVSFSERGSLTENNGTSANVQLLMVMEKFKFFKHFKNFVMEGHDDKLKNFRKSKKKTLIFTN